MLKYDKTVVRKIAAIKKALNVNKVVKDFHMEDDEELLEKWENWEIDNLYVDFIDITMGAVEDDLQQLLSGKQAQSDEVFYMGFDGEILMVVTKEIMTANPKDIVTKFLDTL